MVTQMVTWSIEADYLQACNCDYGCPCEFQAPPSRGFCEGIGVWKILKGKYGRVSLDGLCFGFAAHWPKALHLGNGTAAMFFDERANAEQREALQQIASGQAGGAPFEIIVTTFSTVLEPQYVPFEFRVDGRHGSFKAGNLLRAEVEPVKNPVTGENEGVKIVHDTGFVFKEAEVVSAAICESNVEGIKFSWPDHAGFVSRISYHN
jgi:hypothetical protein